MIIAIIPAASHARFGGTFVFLSYVLKSTRNAHACSAVPGGLHAGSPATISSCTAVLIFILATVKDFTRHYLGIERIPNEMHAFAAKTDCKPRLAPLT
jgi:hypothetical protein